MKAVKGSILAFAVALAGLLAHPARAQESFAKLVGPVKIGEVAASGVQKLPFLTWGGDVATFYANGGLKTKDGSLFNKLGLKVELTPGDDFVAQVRDYVTGKTPYLRGTISQLGQASEVLNLDAKCQPVVFLQLTWSKGDHMVARANLKTLNDLGGAERKVKVALQSGGPHVGMLDDALKTAGIKWQDIDVVWTKGVTGKDGPAEAFRKDKDIDACFVISPDMQALTGGLDKRGDGQKGTVKGAHVLLSTVSMSRSIADVYACRKDYYDKNKDTVAKVAAGYLRGCEELLDLKVKAGKKDATAAATYKGILKMTQDIYGKDTIPSDDDADGLIADARLVGLPGNEAFFKGKGNLSGFEPRMAAALTMAVEGGWAAKRTALLGSDLDFAKNGPIDKLAGGIAGKTAAGVAKDAELDKVLFTFKITFKPNQSDFSAEEYGKDFKRAVEQASRFGNAVITVRGHVDPALCLKVFETAALASKLITPAGKIYMVKGGGKLDLNNPKDMKQVVDLIKKEDFPGAATNLKKLLAKLDELSQNRANTVFDALQKYAAGQSLKLDKNQIRPVGVGILEPVVTRAKDVVQAASNRRVEFSIYSIRPKDHVAEGVEYDY